MEAMTPKQLAALIDHTALRPDTTAADVERVCDEALEFGFGAVCVPPVLLKLAVQRLDRSAVKPTTVVGFPLGYSRSVVKEAEVRRAIADGAEEIDMVMQIGALKAGDTEFVRQDIATVTAAAHVDGVLVKVILEAALLDDVQKVRACECALEAEADFVKTSTGFGPGGATASDVKLMRKCVGGRAGVKAAGGIRDVDTAMAMLEAGADRLGVSGSVVIMREMTDRSRLSD